MILKSFYLNLERRHFPVDYGYGLLKGSRFICNFIERTALKPLKFPADGFNRICIHLDPAPPTEFFVNTSGVAAVGLPFEQERYDRLAFEERPHFYIEMIQTGVRVMEKHCPVPRREIEEALEAFLEGGCLNEWVHVRRNLGSPGLTASLRCKLTQAKFTLNLLVEKAGSAVFDAVVLETDPDENAFAYRFKDVVLQGDKLVVTTKTTSHLIEIPLSSLGGSA